MAEADPHYNRFNGQDVRSIGPGGLVTGGVLNFALQALTAEREDAIVVNPDILRFVINRDPDGIAQVQTNIAVVREIGGQVFMPIQVVNGHYILAVANFTHRTVKFYDSSAPAGIVGDRAVNRQALRVVARIIAPDFARPWDRQFYPCVRQLNGSDCGVSVFLNTLHLLNFPHSTDLSNTLDMPAVPQSMYWTAARSVICALVTPRVLTDMRRGQAALDLVWTSIDAAVAGLNGLPRENRLLERQALQVVLGEIEAVSHHGDAVGVRRTYGFLEAAERRLERMNDAIVVN